MKIIPFVARLRSAVTTSIGTVLERRGFYVQDGAACGEATPLPAFGTEDLATCEAVLRGASTAFAPCAWHALGQLELTRHGDPAVILAARAGVQLGGPDVATSLLLQHNLDALLELATTARATPVVKLKVVDPDATLALLWALRARVPAPRLRLRLDLNGSLDEQQARAFLGALRDDDGVDLVEQPVPAGDVDGLCALARDQRVTIAADEALIDPDARALLLAARAPLAFIWKPQAVGGAAVVVDAVIGRPERVHIVTGFLDTVIAQTLAHATARVVDAITGVPRCHGLGTVAEAVLP
ncbi:MAG: enolase C-terminal domain-like protein [Deltaproteobacteria bacterium]|nr:enolase C-terminal domain-like protein [Deltaproteobacteria bacterium]